MGEEERLSRGSGEISWNGLGVSMRQPNGNRNMDLDKVQGIVEANIWEERSTGNSTNNKTKQPDFKRDKELE